MTIKYDIKSGPAPAPLATRKSKLDTVPYRDLKVGQWIPISPSSKLAKKNSSGSPKVAQAVYRYAKATNGQKKFTVYRADYENVRDTVIIKRVK
jgi:hypothetical protein